MKNLLYNIALCLKRFDEGGESHQNIRNTAGKIHISITYTNIEMCLKEAKNQQKRKLNHVYWRHSAVFINNFWYMQLNNLEVILTLSM